MALVVANNVGALNAQNNLNRSSTNLNRSIERLSSGFKINRGADGPAALVISEKQRAQIAGLKSAISNSEKAVSVVQTAEGALGEINSLLVKIRGLAIDSANSGVNGTDALAANQAEIDNALETITRIANNTQFGEKKLLNGDAGLNGISSSANVSFLTATNTTSAGSYAVVVSTTAERATTTAGTGQTANLAADETLTINGVSITLNAGLSQADVVTRINEFSGQTGVTADIDAGDTRLYTSEFGSGASLTVISNVAAAATSSGFGTSTITDAGVDVAGTIGGSAATGAGVVLVGTAGLSSGLQTRIATSSTNPTLSETGAVGTITVTNNELVFQIGANKGQSVDIAINRLTADSLGIGATNNQFATLADINVESNSGAQDTLGIVDSAINEISNLRGTLGAFQANTLESTTNNLRTTLENTISAESVIRDTDFASEISNFTKQQILVQAGTSVLGNANQTSQSILSLLR